MKDTSGQNLPTGNGLAKELWSIAFPDDEYDDSALQDVFQAALKINSTRLCHLLRTRLTVDPRSIPDWYLRYAEQPWYCGYTFNIDTLWETMSVKFKLERGIRSVSATNPGEGRRLDPEKFDMIYLNGTLEDIPNKVTFSLEQYADRASQQEPAYTLLTSQLLSRPFIFVGTPLDESILWQHIILRRSKGQRGARELRPKSYLVSPQLSLPRQKLLASEYNVHWLKMTAEEFAEQVLKPIESASRAGLAKLKAASKGGREHAIPLVSTLIATATQRPASAEEFLLGGEPTWADLVQNRTIERDKEQDWAGEIEKVLATKGKNDPRLFIITGTAGDGKSTLAKRVSALLSARGKRVGWVDQFLDLPPFDIPRLVSSAGNLELLVIDSAEMYGTSLSHLLNDLWAEKRVKACLLVLRSTSVDKLLKSESKARTDLVEFPTYNLSDGEIERLVGLLDSANRLGVLSGKSVAEQTGAFREKADRQLIVSMIEATSGKSFDEKVCDEYKQLDDTDKHLYCLAAVATSLRHVLHRDELVLALGDASNDDVNTIDKLVRRGLLRVTAAEGYQVRHGVIANTVARDLAQHSQLVKYYTHLARIAAIKLGPYTPKNNERLGRLLRFCTNHETLLSRGSLEEARTLYEELEALLVKNYHFWLQRGCLELEEGSVTLAQNFLDHARALNAEDRLVTVACAHLDFKKACSNPKAPDASELAESAMETLQAEIQIRGHQDAYAFHILGSQGLSWARRGLSGKENKSTYLNFLAKVVREGLGKHPSEQNLKQLADDIKRELLSLSMM